MGVENTAGEGALSGTQDASSYENKRKQRGQVLREMLVEGGGGADCRNLRGFLPDNFYFPVGKKMKSSAESKRVGGRAGASILLPHSLGHPFS